MVPAFLDTPALLVSLAIQVWPGHLRRPDIPGTVENLDTVGIPLRPGILVIPGRGCPGTVESPAIPATPAAVIQDIPGIQASVDTADIPERVVIPATQVRAATVDILVEVDIQDTRVIPVTLVTPASAVLTVPMMHRDTPAIQGSLVGRDILGI